MNSRARTIALCFALGPGMCGSPHAAMAQSGTPDDPIRVSASARSRFSQVALDAFGDHEHPGWDKDLSGALVAREATMAVLDPANTGERAAAAAALHTWFEAIGTGRVPKLDRAFFEKLAAQPQTWMPPPSRPSGAVTIPSRSSGQGLEDGHDLNVRFAIALWRLRSSTRQLFPDNGPRFDQVHQEDLGDCFLLSPLAAMAQRDPESVRRMIVKPVQESGRPLRYRVTFPGLGRTVEVAAPTDGELALPGAAAKPANGLWVRVIEKAYGSLSIPTEARAFRCATDGLEGGDAVVAGATLTGHAFELVHMVGNYKKPMSDAELEPLATAIRGRITAALAAKHLVLAANDAGMPPSIIDNHSYAVIGFDAAADKVELYNTWSERFAPKGPEGFENGYRHERGVAKVPLREFVHAFTNLVVETDRKATRVAG